MTQPVLHFSSRVCERMSLMKTLWILGFSLLTASPVFAQQCYRPYTPSRVPIEIAPSATAPSLRLPLPTPPRTVPSPSDRNSAYNHARPPLVPISNRQQFLPQPAVSLRPTSTISDSHVTTYYPPAAAPRTYPLVPADWLFTSWLFGFGSGDDRLSAGPKRPGRHALSIWARPAWTTEGLCARTTVA